MLKNLLVVLVFSLVAFYLGYSLKPAPSEDGGNTPEVVAAQSYYTCPMHPHIHEAQGGSCPICGMDLVEQKLEGAKQSDADEKAATIHIDPAVINNFSIKTAEVKRGTLYRELLTYGYVNKIESSASSPVRAPVAGRVNYLTDKKAGDEIAEDELLLKLESDSWRQLQQDYLDALDNKDPRRLRQINQQLSQAGFDLAAIQKLKASGKPQSVYEIHAQKRGVLSDIRVAEGDEVSQGALLLSLAPVYPITGYAEVFEGQWRWLQPGQKASMVIRSVPNITWQGEVLEVDDMLMNRSRTLKTRLGFREQPGVLLKPGMQANFTIYAAPKKAVLYVPSDAVIRTGAQARVILALPDGRFRVQPVRIGMEDGRHIEILEGPDDALREGMKVVSSGQFLLDSESQLRAEMQRMHAGPDSPPAEKGAQP